MERKTRKTGRPRGGMYVRVLPDGHVIVWKEVLEELRESFYEREGVDKYPYYISYDVVGGKVQLWPTTEVGPYSVSLQIYPRAAFFRARRLARMAGTGVKEVEVL